MFRHHTYHEVISKGIFARIFSSSYFIFLVRTPHWSLRDSDLVCIEFVRWNDQYEHNAEKVALGDRTRLPPHLTTSAEPIILRLVRLTHRLQCLHCSSPDRRAEQKRWNLVETTCRIKATLASTHKCIFHGCLNKVNAFSTKKSKRWLKTWKKKDIWLRMRKTKNLNHLFPLLLY